MKTQLFVFVALAALLSACGAAAEPTPTVDPSTPTASETPAPVETPTLTPQPTQDREATQQARAAQRETEQMDFIIDVVSPELEKVSYSIDEGELIFKMDSTIRVTAFGPNLQYFNGLDNTNPTLKNFIFSVDVSWDSSGLAGCDILLRSDNDFHDGEYAAFRTMRLSGLPYWDVITVKYNQIQGNLTGEQANSAIKLEAGDVNHYVFVVDGTNVTIYANDVRLGVATLKQTMTEGKIYLTAWQQSGVTTCSYSNGWVWELPEESD